jgi:hypothetical protein
VTKQLYLPVTSINFVLSADDGLVAPPGYFRTANYFEDPLTIFPGHLVGFAEPTHVMEDAWLDKRTREDQKRIKAIDEMLFTDDKLTSLRKAELKKEKEKVTDKYLNVPIILEVELNDSDGKSLKTLGAPGPEGIPELKPLNADQDEEAHGLILIDRALPIRAVNRVLVPGPNTAKILRNDPYLEDVELPFKIEESKKAPKFVDLSTLKGLNKVPEDWRCPGGTDFGLMGQANALCGASALLAAATYQQDWLRGEHHIWIASLCSALTANKFGLGEDSGKDVPDYTSNDCFRPVNPEVGLRASALNEVLGGLNSACTEKGLDGDVESPGPEGQAEGDQILIPEVVSACEGSTEAKKTSKEPSQDISLADLDKEVFRGLAKACSVENWNSSSAIDIVNKVRAELLDPLVKDADEKSVVRKYHKVLGYIKIVHEGNGELDELFSDKTKDYQAARCAMLFVLRSEPDQILEWPKSDKPQGASPWNYFQAVALVGLYAGFGSIRPKWKTGWRDAFSMALDEANVPAAEAVAEWKISDNAQTGSLKISFGDGVDVTFGLDPDPQWLFEQFKSSLPSAGQEQDLNKDQEKALESVAGDEALGRKYKYYVFDVSGFDLKDAVRGNRLLLPRQLCLPNEVEWNHGLLLDYLLDGSEVSPSPETICLFSECCGFPTPLPSSASPEG